MKNNFVSCFMLLGSAVALAGTVFPAFSRDLLCGFQAKGLSMSFGALDPSSNLTVTVPVSASTFNANTAGDCQLVTMTISGNDGLNFSGSRRLKNAAGTDFIPYSLVGLPLNSAAPGNSRYPVFTFNGVVAGNAYANASAGSYSDTVVISVNP